ncbi:hypothetical protein MRY87_07950 [bacterium]|nr:hypothetical protein [bacterium]
MTGFDKMQEKPVSPSAEMAPGVKGSELGSLEGAVAPASAELLASVVEYDLSGVSYAHGGVRLVVDSSAPEAFEPESRAPEAEMISLPMVSVGGRFLEGIAAQEALRRADELLGGGVDAGNDAPHAAGCTISGDYEDPRDYPEYGRQEQGGASRNVFHLSSGKRLSHTLSAA